MPTKTTVGLITGLYAKVGGSVRNEVFGPLAREAVQMAVDMAPYYNFYELASQDLIGITVVNRWDSKRFALTGRQIALLDTNRQDTPYALDGTLGSFDSFQLYRPNVDKLEPGVAVDGTASPLVTTLSFQVAIPLNRKVRVGFWRQCSMPAVETDIIQLDDAYMERCSKMNMHELLSGRQIGGDPANHAFQKTAIAKDLETMKRNRKGMKVNFNNWTGSDTGGADTNSRRWQ